MKFSRILFRFKRYSIIFYSENEENEESPQEEVQQQETMQQQENQETSQTAMKYWQQLDTIPVFQPRPSALMARSIDQPPVQGFDGALHGTFLASLQQDLSPEDSTRGSNHHSRMVKIQPGNPGQSPLENSPFLRQNVSSRRKFTPEEQIVTEGVQNSHNFGQVDLHNVGPRAVSGLPQNAVPVTGVKRPRPNTASMGSSLAQALDLDPGINFFENHWQQFGYERIYRSPDGRFDPAVAPRPLLQARSPSPTPPCPINTPRIPPRPRPRGPLAKRPRGIKRQKRL